MTPSSYRVQEWLGPMLALLLLLASTMTSNAFTSVVVVHQASGRHRVVLAEQRALSSSQDEPTATIGDDHQQEHSCEPILEAKPVVARGLLTRPASLATGTLLALSLFFAPVPTTTDSPVFFVSARPALAAKMAEPPAVASSAASASTPEAQLKSAKSALADASQRVKSADSKAKALDAALQRTEPSITASEKSVKKAKEAVKQAEAKYRDLQKQKKGAKVLDKESMKVGMFVIVCLFDYVFVVTSRM
jgi:hypothetical protein